MHVSKCSYSEPPPAAGRIRGQEEWMDKAQLVFEQTGSSH
jgi:hypothetical protein